MVREKRWDPSGKLITDKFFDKQGREIQTK
jgi:hypothetical protein